MAKKLSFGAIGAIVMFLSLFALGFIGSGTRAYDPEIINVATTTNAATTNIYSMSLGTGKTVSVRVGFAGKSSGGALFNATKRVFVTNEAGTLRILGGTVEDITTPLQDAGLAAASCNITTSGTSVVATVTGVSGSTVNWVTNTVVTPYF
jgi:hypothetical protein